MNTWSTSAITQSSISCFQDGKKTGYPSTTCLARTCDRQMSIPERNWQIDKINIFLLLLCRVIRKKNELWRVPWSCIDHFTGSFFSMQSDVEEKEPILIFVSWYTGARQPNWCSLFFSPHNWTAGYGCVGEDEIKRSAHTLGTPHFVGEFSASCVVNSSCPLDHRRHS